MAMGGFGGMPGNGEEGGGGGVTTQMRRTCAGTVKLSHFVGSASLILMFRMDMVIRERNYFHL